MKKAPETGALSSGGRRAVVRTAGRRGIPQESQAEIREIAVAIGDPGQLHQRMVERGNETAPQSGGLANRE